VEIELLLKKFLLYTRTMKKLLPLLLMVLFFGACQKKNTTDQASVDNTIITNYISSHGLQAKATGSGLYYVVTTPGTGVKPTSTSNVTVGYKGYLTNGNVFDQNANGYSCNLTAVIAGWQEGIPLFKAGGRGTLLIPSALGYGTQGSGSIPPNAVLIFDINLISVP
jgi:FKBP-type peptidyl-prolyl cis-trans isomerase FkpA